MENSCNKKSNSDPVDSDLNKKKNPVSLVCPVVLGSPETILEVDSESASAESEEWTENVVKNNYVIPQTTTINVEKSSDVVIGPLTQFHGPVTIYQNVNLDNRPSRENLNVQYKSEVIVTSSAKPTPESSSSEKQQPTEKKHLVTSCKRLAIYVSIFFTMLISAIVSIVVSLNMTARDANDGGETYFPDEGSKWNSSLGNHTIFTKEKWGAEPTASLIEPLHHPTKYVLVCHTAGQTCRTSADCSSLVQQTQNTNIYIHNLPDIKYNFLVGGDGNIYTGRGWDVRNAHKDHSIAIGFMGNYMRDELTPNMISALKYLLVVGVESKKLAVDYKLVCHNQTMPTQSPGVNAYKIISKLPNFCPGKVAIE